LRFSGDGKHVVSETHLVIRSSPLRPALLELFDAATGVFVASGQVPGRLSHTFMSPDGSRLFVSRRRESSNWSEFSLLDAATGEELAVLEGDQQRGVSAAFSPDSSRLATCDGATTRLWDAATGRELAVLEGSPGQDGDFAFSLDGSRLATTGGGIRLWDVATGKELAVLEGDGGGAIAFSPDGTHLATLRGPTIRLWDAATGAALAVSEQRENTPPRFGSEMLLFSPDGSRLATFDGMKTRLYALSGRDAPAIRERLAPIVAEWFSGDADGAEVSERLAAAKGTMAAEDWREAAILVLNRCRLRIEARQEERLAALPQALRSHSPEVLGMFAEAVNLAGDDARRLNELARDVERAAGEGATIPAPLLAAATAATRRGVL
jgi:dipeptidyl aminopeptidase/acylaminoacyl peptidase